MIHRLAILEQVLAIHNQRRSRHNIATRHLELLPAIGLRIAQGLSDPSVGNAQLRRNRALLLGLLLLLRLRLLDTLRLLLGLRRGGVDKGKELLDRSALEGLLDGSEARNVGNRHSLQCLLTFY